MRFETIMFYQVVYFWEGKWQLLVFTQLQGIKTEHNLSNTNSDIRAQHL